MTTQPWYPASWLDADGKPLPDVYEVTPGEWPPCRPDDRIEVLFFADRVQAEILGTLVQDPAHTWGWHSDAYLYPIVAIRIVERAKA